MTLAVIVCWLVLHTPTTTEYQSLRLHQLTERCIREGAKIILKLPYLAQRLVLIKNQRAILNKRILLIQKLAYLKLNKVNKLNIFKTREGIRETINKSKKGVNWIQIGKNTVIR